MKKNNDTNQIANTPSQQEIVNSRMHSLLRWFHGITTRFIDEAKSICGSEEDEEYSEKRACFTAFMLNELNRLTKVIDIDIDFGDGLICLPEEDDTDDCDMPSVMPDEDLEDLAASEEIFLYQDILAQRISEESRLKAEVALLNSRITDLELLIQNLRDNGNQESGE